MKEPAEYSEELIDKICEEIAVGASVDRACEICNVTSRAFYKWLRREKYAVQEYMRAREIRADTRFESSEKLMNELRRGEIDSNQARILFDEIKWKCGKEAAFKYGDKLQTENTNIQEVRVRDFRGQWKTDAE